MFIFWLYGKWVFQVLNQVKIKGRENLPYRQADDGKKSLKTAQRTKILFVANHLTLVDSWLLGISLINLKEFLFYGEVIPYNAPEFGNFLGSPLWRWLFKLSRTIPVERGGRDRQKMERVFAEYKAALEHGTLLLFLGGRRSKDGEVGECVSGVSETVLRYQPTVVPIWLEKNIQKIMPLSMGNKLGINFFLLRRGYRGLVKIGQPLEFNGSSRREEVGKKLAEAIIALKEPLSN